MRQTAYVLLLVQEKCSSRACGYDGGDCALGLQPYSRCGASIACDRVFHDGHCDEECASQECLLDGGDCTRAPSEPRTCAFEQRCNLVYADGKCDPDCSSSGALRCLSADVHPLARPLLTEH